MEPKLTGKGEVFHQKHKIFQTHSEHFLFSDKFEAYVETKPITKPVFQPFRPLPPEQTEAAMKVINAMVQAGVMKKATDRAWIISQCLVVKKPKSNAVRVLCDLRFLNHFTIPRPTDSITQDQVMAAIAKADRVSTLDLSNAYHSIPIKKEHQNLFTFLGPDRNLYTYTTLPQGWISSASFLNDFLRSIFDKLPFCLCYMDDILVVGGNTDEEHVDFLEQTFTAIIENKLLVKPEKLQILQKEIEFLGVIYNIATANKTVSIPKRRIQGYLALKRPSTRRGLLSFLCSLAFFRRLIPRFAERSYNLHKEALPREKDKGLKWSEALIADYNGLLEAVQTHGVINCPDHDKPFVCFSDASQKACSFLVFQKHPETGLLMLVSCISKSFSRSEQSQHIYYKELLAIINGLEAFSYFLKYEKDILIYTDARGIALARIAKNSTPALLRKLLYLSSFRVTLQHLPGQYNAVADHLSRYNRLSPTDTQDDIKYISKDSAIKLTQKLFMDGYKFTPADIENLIGDKLPAIPAQTSKQRKTTSKGSAKITTLTYAPKAERKIKMPKVRVQRYVPKNEIEPPPVVTGSSSNTLNAPDNTADVKIKEDPDVTSYLKLLNSAGKYKKHPDEWLKQLNNQSLSQSPGDNPLCVLDRTVGSDFNPIPDHYNNLHPKDELATSGDVKLALQPSTDSLTNPSKAGYKIKINASQIYGNPNRQLDQIEVQNPDECCTKTADNVACAHNKPFLTLEILANIPQKNMITPDEFIKCQNTDDRIKNAIASHKQQLTKKFVEVQGILCLKGRPGKPNRPYIPECLINHLTHLKHYTMLGLHRPPSAIFKTINAQFYHPDLKDIIRSYIKKCALCCIIKRSNLPKPEQGTFKHPEQARSHYAMDIAPNLGKTKQGNQHCLVIVDLYSTLVRAIPLKTKTPDELIKAVKAIQNMDATRMTSLRMDGEKAASSEEFANFCQEQGIMFEKTAQNSPQSNGRAEQMIDYVKTSLTLLSRTQPTEWDEHLELVTFAHAKTANSTGHTPELLHFGSEAPSPLNLLNFKLPWSERTLRQINRELKEKRKKDLEQRVEANKAKNAYRKQFQPGDVVLVKVANTQRDGILSIKYKGPYIIEQMEKHSLTATLKATRSNHVRKCHVNQLKHWPEQPVNVLTETTTFPNIPNTHHDN